MFPDPPTMTIKSLTSSFPSSACPALNHLHFPSYAGSSTSTPSKSGDTVVLDSLPTSKVLDHMNLQIGNSATSVSPYGLDSSVLDVFLTKLLGLQLLADFFVNFLPLDFISSRFKIFAAHLEEVIKPPN